MIFLALRDLSPGLIWVDTFISQRYFVLFVVMDMGRALYNAQEYWDSVFREPRTGEPGEFLKVEVCLSLRVDLKGCTACPAFMVWNSDTVDISFEDTGILSEDFGNFCGGTGITVSLIYSTRSEFQGTYTFSLFHRNVSPKRSKKYHRPSD